MLLLIRLIIIIIIIISCVIVLFYLTLLQCQINCKGAAVCLLGLDVVLIRKSYMSNYFCPVNSSKEDPLAPIT
jgi:hypothetical protein